MAEPEYQSNYIPTAGEQVPYDKHEHPDTISRNARYGLLLFGVYLLFYGTFVGISAFDHEVMAKPAFLGVNVAIVFGFGLIGLAFVLALVYMWLCTNPHANADRDNIKTP